MSAYCWVKLSDKLLEIKGIKRMADATVPMDESVAKVAIDISGRSYCNMEFDFTNEKIGDMTSEIVVHFSSPLHLRLN